MRTKYTKLKRALARRKRKAHAIRANKFVQKERKKFIHSFKANAANPAHILQNDPYIPEEEESYGGKPL